MSFAKTTVALILIAIIGIFASKKLFQASDSDETAEPSAQGPETADTNPSQTAKPVDSSNSATTEVPDINVKLQQKDLKVGTGKQASEGRRVQIHAVIKLSDGKVVYDTYAQGKPWDGVVGDGRFIKGLDQGIRGMFEGGKRALWIPSYLAFGTFGIHPHVPPHSKVYAEVELVSVF